MIKVHTENGIREVDPDDERIGGYFGSSLFPGEDGLMEVEIEFGGGTTIAGKITPEDQEALDGDGEDGKHHTHLMMIALLLEEIAEDFDDESGKLWARLAPIVEFLDWPHTMSIRAIAECRAPCLVPMTTKELLAKLDEKERGGKKVDTSDEAGLGESEKAPRE